MEIAINFYRPGTCSSEGTDNVRMTRNDITEQYTNEKSTRRMKNRSEMFDKIGITYTNLYRLITVLNCSEQNRDFQ